MDFRPFSHLGQRAFPSLRTRGGRHREFGRRGYVCFPFAVAIRSRIGWTYDRDVVVSAELFILWAFVNLALFVAAAGAALLSVASSWMADRLGTAGCQVWAQRSQWVARTLTLLLVVDVLGMALTLVVFFLWPHG